MATDNNSVSVGYLSDIQMNFTEMKREYDRLKELEEQVSSAVEALASAINALAALVECDVQVDLSITKSISFSTTAIITDMEYQMNKFSELNELTAEELSAVESYLADLKENNFVGYNGLSFQTNLNLRREVADILSGNVSNTVLSNALNDGENADIFTFNWNSASSLTSQDLYTYLTENYKDDLAELGLTGEDAGKKYVETMLAIAVNNSETNREKSINAVKVLDTICANANVRIQYNQNYHGDNGTEPSLDNIVKGADCSSYVSWALSQGGDCLLGTTKWILPDYIGTNRVDYTELKAGDVLLSGGHTVFILENTGSELIVSHAASAESGPGIKVEKFSYSYCENQGLYGYDMDEYYND